jgi:hypothetical protein
MTTLHNKISSNGNAKMANGDKTTVAIGTYKCSDGTCHDDYDDDEMLYLSGLSGTVRCADDNGQCVLDGEQGARRAMTVYGSGGLKLTIRALTFKDAYGTSGGGAYIYNNAIVDLILCHFNGCRATSTQYSNSGGGAIYISSSSTTVLISATTFLDNVASSEDGDDIYRSSGTITIASTCPSPYDEISATQGEKRE